MFYLILIISPIIAILIIVLFVAIESRQKYLYKKHKSDYLNLSPKDNVLCFINGVPAECLVMAIFDTEVVVKSPDQTPTPIEWVHFIKKI